MVSKNFTVGTAKINSNEANLQIYTKDKEKSYPQIVKNKEKTVHELHEFTQRIKKKAIRKL